MSDYQVKLNIDLSKANSDLAKLNDSLKKIVDKEWRASVGIDLKVRKADIQARLKQLFDGIQPQVNVKPLIGTEGLQESIWRAMQKFNATHGTVKIPAIIKLNEGATQVALAAAVRKAFNSLAKANFKGFAWAISESVTEATIEGMRRGFRFGRKIIDSGVDATLRKAVNVPAVLQLKKAESVEAIRAVIQKAFESASTLDFKPFTNKLEGAVAAAVTAGVKRGFMIAKQVAREHINQILKIPKELGAKMSAVGAPVTVVVGETGAAASRVKPTGFQAGLTPGRGFPAGGDIGGALSYQFARLGIRNLAYQVMGIFGIADALIRGLRFVGSSFQTYQLEYKPAETVATRFFGRGVYWPARELALKYGVGSFAQSAQLLGLAALSVKESGIQDVQGEAIRRVKFALDLQTAGVADAVSVIKAMGKAGADNERMFKQLANSLGIQLKETDDINVVIRKIHNSVAGIAEEADASQGEFDMLLDYFREFKMQFGAAVQMIVKWAADISGFTKAAEISAAGGTVSIRRRLEQWYKQHGYPEDEIPWAPGGRIQRELEEKGFKYAGLTGLLIAKGIYRYKLEDYILEDAKAKGLLNPQVPKTQAAPPTIPSPAPIVINVAVGSDARR